MIYVGVYLIKVIDEGEVELNDVKVKNTHFLCGGILINGGMIRMNRVSFDEIDLIEKSLIIISDGNVVLEECIFNNILLFDGNGSAINTNIKNNKRLIVISFFFLSIFDIFFFLL
jgi:hypothetical protein